MTVSSLTLTGLVGLAGCSGALARYVLGRFIAERAGTQFPLGTFIINISGAFAIGFLSALTTHKLLSLAAQAVLATGFLGGYTTFSTMSWEGVQLGRGGSTVRSVLYLGGSILLGWLAALLGLLIGGLL